MLREGDEGMAERRMIAKTITLSDAFLETPPTARCLYFTLLQSADDDGFVNNPRSLMKITGATNDDMKILLEKKFVLLFENGVIVIKHWRIHNYIQKDRYVETKYKDEKAQLELDENNAYRYVSSVDTQCIQSVSSNVDTQYRDSIGKDRKGKHKYGEYQNVLLTDEELEKLKERFPDYKEHIKRLDEGIELKGYKYKSHYLAILKWAEKGKPSGKPSYTADEMEVEDVDIDAVRKKMFG